MIIANRGPIEDLYGFEVVRRAAQIVLIGELDAEITYQQERWRAADQELEAAGIDVGVLAQGIEYVAKENIIGGTHKSLINSPMNFFPNVSVNAFAIRPGPGDEQFDHGEVVEVTLLVEVTVKAGPVKRGEERLHLALVHRRIERTSEAVLRTIADSGNLLGAVDSITHPRGGISASSWSRDEGEGRGATYMLHGSRFTYALTRRKSI